MIAEPHKIKTIRKIVINSNLDRAVILREAKYNTFKIKSSDVMYDMTSQGTSAKSQEQESGSLVGDETYAGSRNFENLCNAVSEVFGHQHVCPTHNLLGSIKLINTTTVKKGDIVPSNSALPRWQTEHLGGKVEFLPNSGEPIFTGNLNLVDLRTLLESGKPIAYVNLDLYANGYMPVHPNQVSEVAQLCAAHGKSLVLDVSNIVEWAVFVRKNLTEYSQKSVSELVKQTASSAQVIIADAALDARCNIGALIASNCYETYEKYMNEVVVYEGLHTYGGMAGRTMEIFARGLREMILEPQAEWISQQVQLLDTLTPEIPKYVGADGIYIKTDKILTQLAENQAQAFAAFLYQKAGIRCFLAPTRLEYGYEVLPVQIPRLALSNDQIAHVARAINEVYAEREKIKFFELTNSPVFTDEAEFDWNKPAIDKFEWTCEAHTISTIEYIGVSTKEERFKINAEAGFNTFLLPSSLVGIDLLTDSGTCAQTTEQWSHYNNGVETPASSKDYFDMVAALQDITGYKYIIPTHQGRAAEHIMSQALISGGVVPGNMYFTTTKLHQELAGGMFADIICDEAHDSQNTFEWKGNIDLKKLQKLVDQHGASNIPYISFELSVNLAGGQPVSMDNAREVYEFCKSYDIPVMFDATRAVENAYMIKKKDARYHDKTIRDILRELFSYGDGCTVSSKKDYLVNIGGFLGIRDDEKFYKKSLELLRAFEGTITNGGMSAADMAVHAEGVKEMIDYNYISQRVEQTQYLGKKLKEAGIPIVEPVGTHAVFVDARRFLPHIEQDNYPAQALAAALYVDSGVRAMERGNVSSGRKKNGENYRPKLELIRLTIPRRAYTNSHMDLVAESIINLYKKRDQIKPLKFVYEPENLRFFQGKFAEVE